MEYLELENRRKLVTFVAPNTLAFPARPPPMAYTTSYGQTATWESGWSGQCEKPTALMNTLMKQR